MAKRIKNPIEVKATVYFDDTGVIESIEDCSVHFGSFCEHGEFPRQGMDLEQNPEVLNIVKDFVEEGVKQAEAKLEIAPEDSMLYAAP